MSLKQIGKIYTLDERDRATLPKEALNGLGWVPGDKLRYYYDNEENKMVIKKVEVTYKEVGTRLATKK